MRKLVILFLSFIMLMSCSDYNPGAISNGDSDESCEDVDSSLPSGNNVIASFDPEDFAFTLANDVANGLIEAEIIKSDSKFSSSIVSTDSDDGYFIGIIDAKVDLAGFRYQDLDVYGNADIRLEFGSDGLLSYSMESEAIIDDNQSFSLVVPRSLASGSPISSKSVIIGEKLPTISDVDIGVPSSDSTVSFNNGKNISFGNIFRDHEVDFSLNDLPSDTVAIQLVLTNMVNHISHIVLDYSEQMVPYEDDKEILYLNDSGTSYVICDKETHDILHVSIEDYCSDYFYHFPNSKVKTSGRFLYDRAWVEEEDGSIHGGYYTNMVLDDFSLTFDSLEPLSSHSITIPSLTGTVDPMAWEMENDISLAKMDVNVGGHRYVDYGGYAVCFLLYRLCYSYLHNFGIIESSPESGILPDDSMIDIKGKYSHIGEGIYKLNGIASTKDGIVSLDFDAEIYYGNEIQENKILMLKLDDTQLGELAMRYVRMLGKFI